MPINNHRLRQERILRGWSQAKVAQAIGTTPNAVSRWEQGLFVPSPYFREQLCILFGKNADELGLLAKKVSVEQDIRADALTEEQAFQDESQGNPRDNTAAEWIETETFDPTIPLPSPFGLVGREKLLDTLQQRLSGGRRGLLTALYGLPGVGKTALAVEIAHDPATRALFPDGVLWAGLGPRPHILGHLSRWGTLLRLSEMETQRLRTQEDWGRAIRAAIGTRRVLVMIDDAWELDAALALQVGGPNCAHLLTTRFPHLARRFASEGAINVPELDEEDGMTLLHLLTPELTAYDIHDTQSLVRLVGGLPLALTLIGKYLGVQSQSGQRRRVQTALEQLRDAEQRLQLSEARPQFDPHSSLTPGALVSLDSIIAVSDNWIDANAAVALRALSMFPAKPNSFSEEAALVVCAQPVEVLDGLTDVGLLQSSSPGRYTIHQTIADYARKHVGTQFIASTETPPDNDARQRIIAYFLRYVEQHGSAYRLLEQERMNILSVLDNAYEHYMIGAFARGVANLTPFLLSRGAYALAEQYLSRANEAARAVNDTASVTLTLLHQASIMERRGDYAPARTYLEEGLELARHYGYQEYQCDLLSKLGWVVQRLGDYTLSEQYYEEGLSLARSIGYRECEHYLLSRLGVAAWLRGKYGESEDYFQQGLAIVRQQGQEVETICYFINLGSVAWQMKEYEKARKYCEEGLALARQVGEVEYINTLLLNLGESEREEGNIAQAESCYKEGLALARQIGHRSHVVGGLLGLAELRLGQGRYAEAETLLNEAMRETPPDFKELVAHVQYGMARLKAKQGDIVSARTLGEASRETFETLGHNFVGEVNAWLEEIPAP